MKIIIAPDSFKGSLTAEEAAAAMKRGVRRVLPDAEIDCIPMADGGEGTMDALVFSTKGQFAETGAVDPLGRTITGRYGLTGDGKTAVIEMSGVSGLLLLKAEERNPLRTTTFGTGLLILHALDSGYRNLIIGIGGSATNDCGAGMAQALGVRFYSHDRKVISDHMTGDLLGKVGSVDMRNRHPAIQKSCFIAACDVQNPLLGENGCARVYAMQKGATSGIVGRLEENMHSFIDVAENKIGRSVRDIPGAGAAGGLGAGLLLFLGAELHPGADLVMDSCCFSERIQHADLILTGEGKIDTQTVFGKTIAAIASRAKVQKIPVIAFGGIVEETADLHKLGLTHIYPVSPKSMPADQAMANAKMLLQQTVESVIRGYRL